MIEHQISLNAYLPVMDTDFTAMKIFVYEDRTQSKLSLMRKFVFQ